jgi:hypothetical protein
MQQATRPAHPEGELVEPWLSLAEVVRRLNALGVGVWEPQRARRLIDNGYLFAVRRPKVGRGASWRSVDPVSLAQLEQVLALPMGPDRDAALEALRVGNELRAENEARRAAG